MQSSHTEQDEHGVDDYFHLILKYHEKRIILHGSSYSDSTPRFQIHGSIGSFTKHGLDPQEKFMLNGGDPADTSFGKEDAQMYGELVSHSDDTRQISKINSMPGDYKEFYKNIFECLKNDAVSLEVTADQALEVIKVIEICYESSKQGKEIKYY